MKWTKVISSRENMINQEFQHCMDPELIRSFSVVRHSEGVDP
jgi:hypothetical protein